jgi:hypothetical protein
VKNTCFGADRFEAARLEKVTLSCCIFDQASSDFITIIGV